MAQFKSTHNIFTTPWEDEVYDRNWMDSDVVILPPGGPDDIKNQWDYKREMQIEDVDIWEQIYYQGGGLAIYAAWLPYAEFYMITGHRFREFPDRVETYYGPGAEHIVKKRAQEIGIPLFENKVWVDDGKIWLYKKPQEVKKILFT